jgi:hypothetical protein
LASGLKDRSAGRKERLSDEFGRFKRPKLVNVNINAAC